MGKTIYYGTYYRNLDAKGRLLIPSKLVEEGLKEVFVVRGHEGCLAVYDPEGFRKFIAHYMEMDFEDPGQRAKMRLAAASATPTKIDAVGRLLVGKQLLQDYGIGDQITIIGVFDHFEVCDQQAWIRYAVANGLSYDTNIRSKA